MSAKNNLVNSTIIIKKMFVSRQNKTTAVDGYWPHLVPRVSASVTLSCVRVRKYSSQTGCALAVAHLLRKGSPVWF